MRNRVPLRHLRVPLLLAVAGLLAATAHADWPPGKFGFSRVAAYRANPIASEVSVRPTRQFVKVLRPRETQTFSYSADKQYWSVREWSHDRVSRQPTSLQEWPQRRGLWYQWDMLGVPREAVIDKAVLRFRPSRGENDLRQRLGLLSLVEAVWFHHAIRADLSSRTTGLGAAALAGFLEGFAQKSGSGSGWYRQAEKLPPTVFLSERSWVEEARDWNHWIVKDRARQRRLRRKLRRGQQPAVEDIPVLRGPIGELNGPVLEFDVTEELRRATEGEGAHRIFQLVVQHLAHHGDPLPVIGVVYRIPVVAEAERPARLSD